MNATGSALEYSTYLGGSFFDLGSGIAVDGSGNAYITGGTTSGNFPTTAGAFQTTSGGGQDAFVAKLNATGSALEYSTYIGGGNTDRGLGIAVDNSGNAYVTGTAASSNFPTESPLQGNLGGFMDAFVTKLNPVGSALDYSTYVGGSSFDVGHGIAIDANGNAYVTGQSNSTNFPTTVGAYQPDFGGSADAFLAKLNATGSELEYSTYLGGGNTDRSLGIAVDGSGNAYVTGQTKSSNVPTESPLQGIFGGYTDAFVTKLNPVGSALDYSTYLGGSDFDEGVSIAVNASGNAYMTGHTKSTNFPTTAGAFQTASGGGFDAFVAKLTEPNTPAGTDVVQPIDATTGTTPVAMTFSEVTQAGNTSLTTSSSGPPPPDGFKLGNPPIYYDLTTTASFSGVVTVCIDYSNVQFGNEDKLRLLHREVEPNTGQEIWVNRTVLPDTDTDIICAEVSSLSLFLVAERLIQVSIDIKPGSDPNSINCTKENGVIPVAILRTDNFDAISVDHKTVRFGKEGTEAEEIHTDKKTGEPKRHEEDVDGDGEIDLVFHFRFEDTDIECGDMEAKLTGETFGGPAIEGSDAIRTVGNKVNMSFALGDEAGFPESYALAQNYPNPFNPETEIRFQLPGASHVIVRIFNTLGQEIRRLANAQYGPGYHSVRWDGKDNNGNAVASGIYLYQLKAGTFSQVKKMSLLQ